VLRAPAASAPSPLSYPPWSAERYFPVAMGALICCQSSAGAATDEELCNDENKLLIGGAKKKGSVLLTKEQLVEMLVDAPAELSPRGPASGPSAKPKGAVMINMDLVETIFLQEEDEDEEDEPKPSDKAQALRKKGKHGTAYVSKEAVEKAFGRASVRSSENGDVVFVPEEDAQQRVSVGEVAKPKAKRRGTGFVTKEQLLQALNQAEEEDSEDEAPGTPVARVSTEEEPVVIAKARGKRRQQTGFVSKGQLAKVLKMLGQEE